MVKRYVYRAEHMKLSHKKMHDAKAEAENGNWEMQDEVYKK